MGKADNLYRCQREVTRCSVRPYTTATDSGHALSIICPSSHIQSYIRTGTLIPKQNWALPRNPSRSKNAYDNLHFTKHSTTDLHIYGSLGLLSNFTCCFV